mgnify:CR=1 FL=1
MTVEELFPDDKYRIRKYARFEIPAKKLKVVVELFFQKSDKHVRGQFVGEYKSTASVDGTMSLSTATAISPRGEITYYLQTERGLEKILPENLIKIVRAFEKEFQEKYEIIITDEETDALISEMLKNAKWEKP